MDAVFPDLRLRHRTADKIAEGPAGPIGCNRLPKSVSVPSPVAPTAACRDVGGCRGAVVAPGVPVNRRDAARHSWTQRGRSIGAPTESGRSSRSQVRRIRSGGLGGSPGRWQPSPEGMADRNRYRPVSVAGLHDRSRAGPAPLPATEVPIIHIMLNYSLDCHKDACCTHSAGIVSSQ